MNTIKCTLLTTALALVLSGAAFADLDVDADGFLSQTDLPAEHELSLQFAVADTDADTRLSQAEFEAYQSRPEEEESE